MINNIANGMLAIMLAKFMMNDVPHAAGLLSSSFTVKRTTVNKKLVDDLEATWHRNRHLLP